MNALYQAEMNCQIKLSTIKKENSYCVEYFFLCFKPHPLGGDTVYKYSKKLDQNKFTASNVQLENTQNEAFRQFCSQLNVFKNDSKPKLTPWADKHGNEVDNSNIHQATQLADFALG